MATRSDCLSVVLAASLVLSPLAQARAAEPTDYLTPQSVAALTVRLADLAQIPLVQQYPVEVLAAATDDLLGLPLEAIERITAVVEPPMGVMPQYAVVLQSSAVISFDRFRAELTEHTAPGELLGRPLLESQVDLAPSLCLLDDRTLAVGPKLFLKRLVRGVDGSSGELAAAMTAKGGLENQFHAAVLLEPLRPFIELGLMAAKNDGEIPPENHKYLDGLLLLNRVIATADLSGQRESSLTVYTDDKQDADSAETLMAEGIAQFQEKITQDDDFQKIFVHEEATVRAWGAYCQRMFDQQASQLEGLRVGDNEFCLLRMEPGDPQAQLTAVATTGILIALLLPAVQAAREAARRTSSMNNAKQLALSLLVYESTYGRFPAQAICAPDGTPLLSWRVAILPFLEETDLYNRFHLDEPWDSPHNKALLAEMPEVFLDPSSKHEPTDGKSSYLGVAGPRALFTTRTQGRRMLEVTDGTSRTLMTVQVDDQHAVEWTRPVDFDPAANAINPIGGIGTLHPGGFLAGRIDGSFLFVSEQADVDTLNGMMTVDGGEPATLP